MVKRKSVLMVFTMLALGACILWASGQGPEKASSAPVTVTIFGGGPADFPGDNPIWAQNPVGKYITEKTGVEIKMDIPTGQSADDKLNLMLASGDYPEVFATGNLTIIGKAISEGIALPLDDMIAKYGANIRAAFGKNLSKQAWSDGRIYYIGQKPGLPDGFKGPPTGYGSGGFSIRKDVYLALKQPKVDTIDDIYAVLKSIKQQYTKTPSGETIWPASAFYRTWQNIRDSLAMGAGFFSSGRWYRDDAGKLWYWTRGPAALTISSFLNKIYREGLLDPDYVTQEPDAWEQKVANGRAVAGFNPWWMNWTLHANLEAAGFGKAEDLIFLNFPFSVPGGQKPTFVVVSSVGGPYKVITKAAKNPEAAFRLLDALAEPEMAFIANNGVKGGMWDYVGGKPTMKKEFVDKFNAGSADEEFSPTYGYRMYHYLAVFPGNDVQTKWATFWILKDDPVTTGNPRAAERDRLFSPTWYDQTPYDQMMKGMSDEVAAIWTQMDDRLMNEYYKVVTAPTAAEFTTRWNAYLAGLETIGMKRVEEFVNTGYQAFLKK